MSERIKRKRPFYAGIRIRVKILARPIRARKGRTPADAMTAGDPDTS